MTNNEIEQIIHGRLRVNAVVRISFKSRSSLNGIFIKTADYRELSRKNLWRIVSEMYIPAYKQSQDESLARIFNGTDFTRLEVVV